MKKKLGFLGIALASVLAIAAPTVASARDRDDFRRDRDHHEYREHRDRDRWEYRDRAYRPGVGFGIVIGNGASSQSAYQQGYQNGYSQGYQNGYYDQSGNWHAEPQRDGGYYDQRGNWQGDPQYQQPQYQQPQYQQQPDPRYYNQRRN